MATVDVSGLHVTFIPAPEAFTPWMKWRNENFSVKTVCCKELQRLCLAPAGQCQLSMPPATVTAHGTECCQSWAGAAAGARVFMKCVLCRLHTPCSIEGSSSTDSSSCGMSSFLTALPANSPAKAFGGCFQARALGISAGMSVRSHAYCTAEFLRH